jgi:obg-like ATPase 1
VSSIQVSDIPCFGKYIKLTTNPDFEKTFIQCIVFNYETLRELGDEPAVKTAGKVMTKGKDYVVEDGDIILIKAGAAKA